MYDVAIMGSGMVGTILGAILARQGAKVLIIDSGRHPRFAIGESTLRETTMMLKIMAERFDVPELVYPSSYVGVRDHIGTDSGMKRHLSYVYHREGQRAHPDEMYQVVIPETFDGPEIHYFRQEIDAYLAKVAVRYGATLLEETRVTDIDISEEKGVTLTASTGERFEAKFVVDATGFRSVLSDKYDLRENPSRFKTQSRSIFTHMTNVKRYEDCGRVEEHNIPYRWSQGTLHHCFDGGWLWVIPFDNGPAPKNPLVSVGLQFDIRKYPNRNIPPEEEFRDMIARFPSIAEQFEHAVAARPWVTTGDRMQWSSKRTIGPRFCLTAHAAGSLGPLTSRGLILSTRALYPLAEILLDCIKDDDFSESRFQIIDDLHQVTLDNTDSLVNGFYISWRDWNLFNAWLRIWYTTGVLGFFHIEAAYSNYKRTRNKEELWHLLYGTHVGSFVSAFDGYQPFFAEAGRLIHEVDAGTLSAAECTAKLNALVKSVDFLPPGFNFAELDKKTGGPFNREHWESIINWGNHHAPREVKESLYRGDGMENVDRFLKRLDEAYASTRLKPIRDFLEAEGGPQVRKSGGEPQARPEDHGQAMRKIA